MSDELPPVEAYEEQGHADEMRDVAAMAGAHSAEHRMLPHNISAEKALLGAIFSNNRAHERVCEFLHPEHFALPEHGLIYGECIRLIDGNKRADPITLMGFVENNDDFKDIGGKTYLAELAASAVTIMNAGEYGRIIYDLHMRRELIMLCTNMADQAYEQCGDETAKDLIEGTEHQLSTLVGDSVGDAATRQAAMASVLSGIQERFQNPGKLLGHSTGFSALDRILKGLRDTDLLVVAGRPSMGKTALVMNIAKYCAAQHQRSNGEDGAPTLVFSLEMSAEQIYERLISADANVPIGSIEDGRFHEPNQFDQVVNSGQGLASIPLFIDDRGSITVAGIRAHARRMKRKWGIGLIVIDYLQLISTPGKSDGRVNDVSAMTRALKNLAKELRVPVILLSQLSRNVESRDPPVPRLADLRESGSIEQDADVVMFVYREEYYHERKEPRRRDGEEDKPFFVRKAVWEDHLQEIEGMAEVLVEKNRKGKIGQVKLTFRGSYTQFVNRAYQDEQR